MISAVAPATKHGALRNVLRFVAAGAVNTLISLIIYQAALFVTGHLAAYGFAYAVGVVLAYWLYARHVFAAQTSARGFVLFAALYCAAGVIGALINAGLIESLGWHARIAILATVVLMLPVNYLASRWCLLRAPNNRTEQV